MSLGGNFIHYMEAHMNRVLSTYNRLQKYPLGTRIFSKMVCFKAPYFNTIKPVFSELQPGSSTITMKKRRSVTNHIGSVHAIAMCNMAELVGGTMVEVTLSGEYRWIPRSMSVQYKRIARTSLTAYSQVDPGTLNREQDIDIPVSVKDENGEEVFSARITMHISKKK